MEMKVKLVAWSVPNYVTAEKLPGRKHDSFGNTGSQWDLTEVDEETLSDMCDQFRKDVFTRAKKIDPRTITEGKQV